MRLIIVGLLVMTILLVACEEAPTTQTCDAYCDQTVQVQECPTINCPFAITFDTDHYYKQQYFTVKPILPDIDAEDCDQAFEEQYNATAYLCKIQHAEMLSETGRRDGKNTWQWRLDCVCSYQP